MAKYLSAPDYLAYWRRKQVWTHLEWPKHIARLHWCADQCVGETFADAGCAFGHSTDIMRKRNPGTWVGVEFDPEAAKEAAAFFPDIDFVGLEGVSALSLIGPYDSVVCSEVLEHVEDDKALVDALLSVTRRRLIITTPCIDAKDPGHVRIYDKKTLSRLFVGESATIRKGDVFWYVVIDKQDYKNLEVSDGGL